MRKVPGYERLRVGDVDDLREADLSEIDFIVNLSSSCSREMARDRNYCHFYIEDAEQVERINYPNFKSITKLVIQRLEDNPDETVLVNCGVGISRSVTIASTVAAWQTARTLESVIDLVRKDRIRPSPALVEYGHKFINEKKEAQ